MTLNTTCSSISWVPTYGKPLRLSSASPQTEFFAFGNLLPGLSGGSPEATQSTSGLARLLVGSVLSSVASRPFRSQGYCQFEVDKNHSLQKFIRLALELYQVTEWLSQLPAGLWVTASRKKFLEAFRTLVLPVTLLLSVRPTLKLFHFPTLFHVVFPQPQVLPICLPPTPRSEHHSSDIYVYGRIPQAPNSASALLGATKSPRLGWMLLYRALWSPVQAGIDL